MVSPDARHFAACGHGISALLDCLALRAVKMADSRDAGPLLSHVMRVSLVPYNIVGTF